jgi:hypothetical protein
MSKYDYRTFYRSFDDDRYERDDDDDRYERDDDDDRYERDDDDDRYERDDDDDRYERDDDDDRYERDDDNDHEHDYDHVDADDIVTVGGVTYTETSDDVYVSSTGATIIEADDDYDHVDADDIVTVGGVTYTETSDDVYVSSTGATFIEAEDRYDTDFVVEALNASNATNYESSSDSIRFTTTKEVQVTGSAVDMEDFSAIISHIVGVNTLSAKGQVAADVDGNGTVDINDAVQVLLKIWNGTQTNEFALVGASDISTAELVMIGDVNDSASYIDMIA